MVSLRRTDTCGELTEKDIGKDVRLTGWVHRVRDLGHLIFIDLRDRFGITQIVLDPKSTPEAYATAQKLRFECVIAIDGKVSKRKDPNPNIPTGQIEIFASHIALLSFADVLPFSICDETVDVNEEKRLEYRYLDMRRGPIINNLLLRHRAMMATRKFLDTEGFTEVTTPVLGKSTPEGARDYLVPSRIYPGSFYALPQSPQMFKQILMIGGLDRYFQIATCFRDEDLRHDRQPEFQQIDLEMSFATTEDLFPIVERLMQAIFRECKQIELKLPFKRMTYDECMRLYGCDKPDIRFGLQLQILDDLAKSSSFSVFLDLLKTPNNTVKGFSVPGGADISRKTIDEYTAYIAQFGAKGLAWIKRQDDTMNSTLSKFIKQEEQQHWFDRLKMKSNDIAFVVAGPKKVVNQALDHLRRKIAKERNLIPKDSYELLWVTDFPLFAWNDEEKRMESEHHPFTSPHLDDLHMIEKDPLKARSSSYDLVLNGYEILSGSQRIHDGNLQDKIFAILGMGEEERKQKFGFFIEALRYGTPPHLGAALGFDRIVMILAQAEGIRDVIAFPKTQKASDLMTKAPSQVHPGQLQDLKLSIQMNK
jgi:aspartyl-tRNA synthetase